MKSYRGVSDTMNHDYELRFYLAFQKYQDRDYDKSREVVLGCIEEQPDDAEAIHLLGMIEFEQGNHAEAIELYKKSIELDPSKEYFYNNLFQAMLADKKIDELIDSLSKAHEDQPESPVISFNLAKAYELNDDDESAFKYYKKAIELNPEYIEAIRVFGRFLYKHDQFELSHHYFQKAIELDDQDVDSIVNAANCLYELEFYDNAQVLYEKALEKDPGNKLANTALAACLKADVDSKRAYELLDRALETDPNFSNALSIKANMLVLDGEYEKAYELLKPKLNVPNPEPSIVAAFSDIAPKLGMTNEVIEMLKEQLEKADTKNYSHVLSLNFSLGTILDKQKDYKNAFKYIRAGNELKRANYSHTEDLEKFSQAFEFYTKHDFKSLPHASNHSELPIFIVGMPRSGTTLTEQILSMHPKIHGAGELGNISKLAKSMHLTYKTKSIYPNALLELDNDILDKFANEHLEFLQSLDPEAKHVVDKMPHNFQYVGLIKLLFPNSKIIHCIRDPHDTALSIYFQNFMGTHAYAYNLEHIAFHIGSYLNYMKLWKEILGFEIHDVVYEEMVENQEDISRKLIDFAGLEWDDACLNFHKSTRKVSTASHTQVRNPIYKTSKKKWKNYEEEMQPFTDMLNKILI